MNTVKTVYLLESVDTEKRVGLLKIKPSIPKNAKWTSIPVSISGLLAYRIAHEKYDGLNRGDMYVGTKFESTINSKEFAENPFKLTKFIPVKRSDIPENYKLELVTERFSPTKEVIDALGNKMKIIQKFRRTLPKYFLRFEVVETEALMKDFAGVIVVPKK